MITRLLILNFGIIDKLEIEFDRGFTVLTGETGSGKSLILNALSLLFSSRIDSSWVKSGADTAVIEAIFDVSNVNKLKEFLEEQGYPVYDELTVRRVISSKGRAKLFVNHVTSTVKIVRVLKDMLLEIQSQRDLRILNNDYQLTLLDRFAKLDSLLAHYTQLYQTRRDLLKKIEFIEEEELQAKRRLDYLNFVISEIEKVNPNPQEEEELVKERDFLTNIEKLKSALSEALFLISESELSASYLLRKASAVISDVSSLDIRVSEYLSKLGRIVDSLDELSISMGSFVNKLEAQPERLEEIEARLNELYRLKAKYGKNLDEVLEFYEEAVKERNEIEARLFSKEELFKKLKGIEAQLLLLADELSHKRKEAASILEKRIALELGKLGFDYSNFKVNLRRMKELGIRGYEEVEFLFSANPDVPLLPLNKVASGGELSRVLLALKTVFSDFDDVPILLLDEIDSGIGGKSAELVGIHLRDLGEKKQIIAITHFPQVALQAHHHMKVEKVLKDGKTFVRVFYISGYEKERELERMIGDIKVEGEVQ